MKLLTDGSVKNSETSYALTLSDEHSFLANCIRHGIKTGQLRENNIVILTNQGVILAGKIQQKIAKNSSVEETRNILRTLTSNYLSIGLEYLSKQCVPAGIRILIEATKADPAEFARNPNQYMNKIVEIFNNGYTQIKKISDSVNKIQHCFVIGGRNLFPDSGLGFLVGSEPFLLGAMIKNYDSVQYHQKSVKESCRYLELMQKILGEQCRENINRLLDNPEWPNYSKYWDASSSSIDIRTILGTRIILDVFFNCRQLRIISGTEAEKAVNEIIACTENQFVDQCREKMEYIYANISVHLGELLDSLAQWIHNTLVYESLPDKSEYKLGVTTAFIHTPMHSEFAGKKVSSERDYEFLLNEYLMGDSAYQASLMKDKKISTCMRLIQDYTRQWNDPERLESTVHMLSHDFFEIATAKQIAGILSSLDALARNGKSESYKKLFEKFAQNPKREKKTQPLDEQTIRRILTNPLAIETYARFPQSRKIPYIEKHLCGQ